MEDPANGASYLVIADVMGNVYDMLPVSKYPCEVNGWLKNDVFIIHKREGLYNKEAILQVISLKIIHL